MTGMVAAGGFAMACAPARAPRPDFSRFTRALDAAGFYQPWHGQRDPLIYRSEPLPLPDVLKVLPGCLTDPTGATHMRVTVQLWDDGGHRVSHELGDGELRWRGDTVPTRFSTVGEMLVAIAFQPEHRRRVWVEGVNYQRSPHIADLMA